MNKQGITVVTIGLAAQLSALVWNLYSVESCPDVRPRFNQLSSGSRAPAEPATWDPPDTMAPAPVNQSFFWDEAPGSENTSPEPARGALGFEMARFQWVTILGGIIALAGLLMLLFYKKKKPRSKFHIYPAQRGSLLALENLCVTCNQVISFSNKTIKAVLPFQGVWIIEITITPENKQRSIEAVRQMELSVVRREHEFIIIGPYRQKQDAAEILQKLKEKYRLRAWLEEGN